MNDAPKQPRASRGERPRKDSLPLFTPTHLKVISILAESPDGFLQSAEIAKKLYRPEYMPRTAVEAVRVFISKIRIKLGPAVIESKYRKGYKLNPAFNNLEFFASLRRD